MQLGQEYFACTLKKDLPFFQLTRPSKARKESYVIFVVLPKELRYPCSMGFTVKLLEVVGNEDSRNGPGWFVPSL